MQSNFQETISNLLFWQLISNNGSVTEGNYDIDECNANSSNSLNNLQSLHDICKCNLNRFIICHLNVNSSRNKFESLTAKITGTVDILVISGARLDNNFMVGQFILKGGYLLKPTGDSIKAFL